MDCPRCGATASPASPECPRCGVILAKASGARPSRPAVRPPRRSPSGPPLRTLALAGLGLAAVLAAVGVLLRRPAAPPAAVETVSEGSEEAGAPAAEETWADEALPAPVAPPEAPPVSEEVDRAGEA
ncbi:MAG TPA: hypothetical protein VGB87_13375, partial [Vicinamibacteria bacterium]